MAPFDFSVPDMLPSVQVDRGAIKFVLSGANIMSPGLTSAGGHLPDPSKGETPLKKGQCVAIKAQGKDEILAVGVMQMDTEEVRKTGKGIAIENIHYLGGEFLLQAAYCERTRCFEGHVTDRRLDFLPFCSSAMPTHKHWSFL